MMTEAKRNEINLGLARLAGYKYRGKESEIILKSPQGDVMPLVEANFHEDWNRLTEVIAALEKGDIFLEKTGRAYVYCTRYGECIDNTFIDEIADMPVLKIWEITARCVASLAKAGRIDGKYKIKKGDKKDEKF